MNPPTPATAVEELDELATAITRQLGRGVPPVLNSSPDEPDSRMPRVSITGADGDISGAVLVAGTAVGRGAVVAAAVDDGMCRNSVVRYAAAQARRRQLPLRVVHVWTGHATAPTGGRMTRHDQMAAADLLLSDVLYDLLTADQAGTTEREILHDSDAGMALIALSAEAALIVVAAHSTPAPDGEPLGDTVRALVGRTACPLAVLPACRTAVKRRPR